MQQIHLRPVWTLSQPSDYHFILTFQFRKYSICVIDLFSGDSFKAGCAILHITMLYNSSKLVVQLFIPQRAVGKKILIMDKQLTAWFNLQ